MNELAMSFGHRMLLDPLPGYPERMCWRSVAKEFGIRRWRKEGKKLTSVGNLLRAAWAAGPVVFGRFVAYALKRIVRLHRLRGRRPSPTNFGGPQPFWREEAERINAILSEMGQRISEFEDNRWLAGLPRRMDNYLKQ